MSETSQAKSYKYGILPIMREFDEGIRFVNNLVFRGIGLKLGTTVSAEMFESAKKSHKKWLFPFKQYGIMSETAMGLIFGTAGQLIAPGISALCEPQLNVDSPLRGYTYSHEYHMLWGKEAVKDTATCIVAGLAAVGATLLGHSDVALEAGFIAKGAANTLVNIDSGIREFRILTNRNRRDVS